MHVFRQKNLKRENENPLLPKRKIILSLLILIVLIFSKYFYLASMVSYLTFYMIEKFHVSVQHAQISLFIFAFSVAAGTLLGGPLGDRFGRKYVIWFSILGVAPFTLVIATCQSFLDGDSYSCYWIYTCICFFRHPRICAGIITGEDRFDLRTFFWFRVWNGWTWFSFAGCACRSQGNYLCLPGLRVSAADWITYRVSSEYWWKKKSRA